MLHSALQRERVPAVLGDNHRLREKLEKHGKRAPAEVLQAKERPWANSRGGLAGKAVYKLKLRVSPPGEPAFDAEFTDEWSGFQLTGPEVGTKVSVLYDPQNHSKVVLSSGRGRSPSHVAPAPAGVDLDPELQALYEQSIADTAPGASMPAAAPADHSQARLDALQQLAELHDHGVLTDDEFAAEKAKILNEA